MKFFCRYPSAIYVLVPTFVRHDSAGNRYTEPGKEIKFESGLYETNDEEEIKKIKELKVYGVEITSDEVEVMSEQAKQVAKQEDALTPQALSCPRCSFKGKSNLALKAHIRSKHASEDDEVFEEHPETENQITEEIE